MSPADFPHPLPRRHGTGIEAIARLARVRAVGFGAAARVVEPLTPATREWVDSGRAFEDFEAALGWRQGEEAALAAPLAGLGAWARAGGRRADAGRFAWVKADLAWGSSSNLALATLLRDLEGRTIREAEAWAAGGGGLAEARAIREATAALLVSRLDSLDSAFAASEAPAPLSSLLRLGRLVVRAESGEGTTQYL